jgi:hypothetical protein
MPNKHNNRLTDTPAAFVTAPRPGQSGAPRAEAGGAQSAFRPSDRGHMHPTSPTIPKALPQASMSENRHPTSAERSRLAGQPVSTAQAMLLVGYAQVHLAE